MKALIMAGGYGTRLWPITRNKPKPLLPVDGEPILDHIISKLETLDIDEIFVSTNSRFEHEFKEWSDGANIVVEETNREDEKLGTIGAMSQLVDEIDDDVLVLGGDNIFTFPLEGFLNFYKDKKTSLMASYDVGSLEKAKEYGVVNLSNDNKITDFVEKPNEPKSSLVGVALYIFPRKTFKKIPRYLEQGGSPDSPGNFIQWLYKNEDVYSYTFDNEDWFDIGTPDSYLEANRVFMNGKTVDTTAKIDEHVVIEPPVHIGKNVKIEGRSFIGPYAYIKENSTIVDADISQSIIFDDVKLNDVEIWKSIVDEKCEIRNLELRKSIVGGHAQIQRG